MSRYFARLATSHGASPISAVNPVNASAPERSRSDAGMTASLPEVAAAVDAAAAAQVSVRPDSMADPAVTTTPVSSSSGSSSAFARTAAMPAAPTPSANTALKPPMSAAPRGALRPDPPMASANAVSDDPTPAGVASPTRAEPRQAASRAAAGRLSAPATTHLEPRHITRNAPAPLPAVPPRKDDEVSGPAVRAMTLSPPQGMRVEARSAAPNHPAAGITTTPVEQSVAKLAVAPAVSHGATIGRVEPRIASPAPGSGSISTIAAASASGRETQVHIGRVELLVTAPSHRAPVPVKAPRATGAPAAERESFNAHRHYVRVY